MPNDLPDFYIIPSYVAVDTFLKDIDFKVFAIVYTDHTFGGKCEKQNQDFAEILGRNINTIQKSLKRLEQRGYIERQYKGEAKRHRESIKVLVRLQINTKEVKQKEIQGQQINRIFNILYKVNPNIDFSNKTSRKKAAELIKNEGQKETERWARYAVEVYEEEYAPLITTPYQLYKKLSKLKACYKRRKNNKEGKVHDLSD